MQPCLEAIAVLSTFSTALAAFPWLLSFVSISYTDVVLQCVLPLFLASKQMALQGFGHWCLVMFSIVWRIQDVISTKCCFVNCALKTLDEQGWNGACLLLKDKIWDAAALHIHITGDLSYTSRNKTGLHTPHFRGGEWPRSRDNKIEKSSCVAPTNPQSEVAVTAAVG